MVKPSSHGRTQVKSAGRALELLEVVAGQPTGLTFTELVGATGFPKSSLYELLSLLADRSYLRLDQRTRRYVIGIKAWEVGQRFAQHREVVDVVRPSMEGVVALLNETVQMSVLDGLQNVYLAKVDCTHPIRMQTDVGERFPAHATALGKVLLAALAPNDLAARLRDHPLERLTANTTTEADQLLRELLRIHAQGFALDLEEGTEGLRCVAVPVHGHDGVVAAISASMPAYRASPARLALALRLLARASLDVSSTLGGSGRLDALHGVLDRDDTSLLGEFERIEHERRGIPVAAPRS